MARRYDPVHADRQGPLAILISHPSDSLYELTAASSPPGPSQVKVGLERKLLKRGQHRGELLARAVVSIVSVVAILALLALCRTSQRRLNSGGSVRRNLSDAEDEDRRSSIIDQCLDLEEELGLGPAASPPSEEADEAKARLVSMLYESASTFEQMGFIASRGLEDEAHPPPPKIPRVSESRTSAPYPQQSVGAFVVRRSRISRGSAVGALDADAWVEEESELVLGEGDHQAYTTKQKETPGARHGVSASLGLLQKRFERETFNRPSASFSFGREHSGDYAVVPDAWLDESVASKSAQPVRRRVVSTLWQVPALETSSAASSSADSVGTPSKRTGGVDHSRARAAVDQESGEAKSVQMEAVQGLDQPKGATALTSHDLKGSVSATAMRATSGGDGRPCRSKHIHRHPFVRLPAVDMADVRRHFTEMVSVPFSVKVDSPMDAYMTMRTLFAKPSLTAEDVDTLMRKAQLVVRYAMNKLTLPCKRRVASCHFVKLSSLFMAFDHLVCTIELLGEKMDIESWWPEFVQKFQTDYSLAEEGRMRKSKALTRLVNRLSAAMSIYKQGRRPALEEVIELKRAIISQAYEQRQLANPLWDLWMQDDREFSFFSSQEDVFSDVEARGQREPRLP